MNLPITLTVSRMLAIPVVVIFYVLPFSWAHPVAAIILAVAALTDWLDGYLARRRNEMTDFGAYIDPLADKLLLLSGFLSLSLIPSLPSSMHMPAWVTIPVLSRDIFIVLGSAVIFVMTGKLKAKPLYIGKITTVVQMGTLFCALVGSPEVVRLLMEALTVLFTVLSGILYVAMGGDMLKEAS